LLQVRRRDLNLFSYAFTLLFVIIKKSFYLFSSLIYEIYRNFYSIFVYILVCIYGNLCYELTILCEKLSLPDIAIFIKILHNFMLLSNMIVIKITIHNFYWRRTCINHVLLCAILLK